MLVLERGERGVFVSGEAYDVEAGLSAYELNPVVFLASEMKFLGRKLFDDVQEVLGRESDLSFLCAVDWQSDFHSDFQIGSAERKFVPLHDAKNIAQDLNGVSLLHHRLNLLQ